MSLFESFLGHAASSYGNTLGEEIKQEDLLKRDAAMEKMREELLIDRTKTIEAMKRAASLQAGQDISAEAEKIGKARIDKDVQTKMAADPELGGMQPGDQEALDSAKPSQLKEVGLMGTMSRSAKLDDRATAAENLGYMDQAKETRGQQQIEISRDQNERRLTADEKRNELGQSQLESKERIAKAESIRKDEDSRRREDLGYARIEAIAARAAKGDKEEKVISYLDGTRKAIAEESSKINALMKADLEGVKFGTDAEKAAVKSQYQPKLDEMEEKRKQLDADFKASRQKFGLPDIPEKPTAVQAVKSDKAITQAEYAKLPSGAIFTAPDGTKRRKP